MSETVEIGNGLAQRAEPLMALPPEGAPEPTRSMAARTLAHAFADRGAKIGLAWILIVAFFGVFGPLLANSYPLLVKTKDGLGSPMLRYLNWADVSLLLGTIGGAIAWLASRRLETIARLGIVLGLYVVLASITYFTVRPPQLQSFERYRLLQRDGEIEWAIRAPIPFSPTDRLRDEPFDPKASQHPRPPSREHWMGTEQNHSDIASRMIHASRIAMTIGFISTGLSTVIGIVIGALCGYFAGWVDLLGQRVIEVFSAIPSLFLMLAAVAFFGRNLYIIMLIIGLTSWVGIAQFVRAEFLRLRNVDFVHAAHALGLPLPSILFRHLLPNALAPVLVNVSFGVAGAILSESGLSFLGLGLIDEPSWGALLSQAVGSTGGFQWWLAFFPGLAIFLTVLAYNLIGESLRDALDPKLLQRE